MKPTQRPRILLLTHHFPPSDAVGALRWQKFIHHFAERGWSFDVVTAAGAAGPPDSEGRLPDGLPDDTRVHAVALPESFAVRIESLLMSGYRWAKERLRRRRRTQVAAAGVVSAPRPLVRPEGLHRSEIGWNLGRPRGWVRLWFTLRDVAAGRAGARRVARAARAVADPRVHSVIITSGPPHYWHEAGRQVARSTGIPLVLDLRDPWSVTDLVHEYFATPSWLIHARRMERRAIEQARLIVTNTETLREEMTRHFPAAADRILAVMNGFDDDPPPPAKTPTAFTIGYAGSIYFGRDPRPLFAGAAAVIRELDIRPQELRIRFMGDVSHYGGVAVEDLAHVAGIGDYVDVEGRRPREEAQRFMASCHVLVSLPWEDGLTIPAKLFEYMRFRAWLLVFAEPGSAMERLLRDHEADVVGNADVSAVAAAIRRRFEQFRRGEQPAPFSADRRLSRGAQAAILIDALEPLRPSGSTRTAPMETIR